MFSDDVTTVVIVVVYDTAAAICNAWYPVYSDALATNFRDALLDAGSFRFAMKLK